MFVVAVKCCKVYGRQRSPRSPETKAAFQLSGLMLPSSAPFRQPKYAAWGFEARLLVPLPAAAEVKMTVVDPAMQPRRPFCVVSPSFRHVMAQVGHQQDV